MAELNSTGMDASMADESRINRLMLCWSAGTDSTLTLSDILTTLCDYSR